ncbi:MAG TPA: ABC transporter ATP-binding protein [Candidatus Eisenbacteria bacterium]|nr:ABC transporter ATP-binding protein [Candidatus Eisenbacteria bacterium]
MLRASFRRSLGSFTVEAAFEALSGETLVLVGESGSGKTMALRMLAGLMVPDDGEIELEGETYYHSTRGRFVPPDRRSIGYMAQNYALFPHLSALENVAFGLRASGAGKANARRRARTMLDRLEIVDLADRRPSQMSGGQQQRVALARALVLEPRLLLLDEPLAALDLATRRTVRTELAKLLAALPCVTVYVTHSPAEALVLGDLVAVMEEGRVRQMGTRDDLLRHPRSQYVAEFLGLNLFQGRVRAHTDDGLAVIAVEGGDIYVAHDVAVGESVHIVVDPREVVLSDEPPHGSARNVFAGPIEEMVPEPPGDRLRVALGSRPPMLADITRGSAAGMGLVPGRMAYASFKATGARMFR